MSAVLIGAYYILDHTCEQDKEGSLYNPANIWGQQIKGVRPLYPV